MDESTELLARDRRRPRSSDVAWFLGAAVLAAVRLPRQASAWSSRMISDQIRFTFLQGLPLVALIAFPVGLAVAVEALRFKSIFGADEALGLVIVLILIRHFGPVLTAMLTVGRSGTAIATEMATVRFTGEVDGLRAIGVDPMQYYVVPRLIAGAVSMPALLLVFDFAAVAGAWVAASLSEGMTWGVYTNVLYGALDPYDVPLTLLKGALFGTGMVVFTVHAGLVHARTPTAIPVAASKGVIRSFLFVFVCALAFILVPGQ